MSFLRAELTKLDQTQLRRKMRTHTDCPGRTIEIDGRACLNFSSNNYLGLADHEELKQGAREALVMGAGSTASRLVTGNTSLHEQLESELAAFHNVESVRLFGSGYQANVGLLSCLANSEDLIVSDQLNHASLIDGIRLSKAACRVTEHLSLDAVRVALEGSASFRRRFVVTDSVFSMDGDSPDLVGLRQICDQMDAFLVVDEAHAVACLGAGAGLCFELGIVPDALVGGLGKGFGSYGGYVAGSSDLTEYLLNRARSFVFSTALPPAILGAGLAALRLVGGDEGEQRRLQLRLRIGELKQGLDTMGRLEVGSGATTIFPFLVGAAGEALELGERLLTEGIYCQAIRPPTVEVGRSRLRIALCADHTKQDIQELLSALQQCSTWNIETG